MKALPVMLSVRGRRCVVVGGGGVGLRRARSLVEAGAEVIVVASEPDPEFKSMQIEVCARSYVNDDLAGAFLVVIATDDQAVNQRVADDASREGVLVNRADDPGSGDLVIPAHTSVGPVTIAVSTGGISARAAGAIRRELSDLLDPDWPILLETIAPYRKNIKQEVTDPYLRNQRLKQLSGPDAMRELKIGGQPGLHRYCQHVLNTADEPLR